MDRAEAHLGVYYPVDPSIYDKVYPTNPGEHVKEIAGLFTELIQLLVDMRYLDKDGVAFPPHREYPINLRYPARYGLTKDVVDIYQMIPYVTAGPNWNHGSDAGEFVCGGEFLGDLRQTNPEEDMMETWEQSVIDPTYGIDWRNWNDEADRVQMSWKAERGPYIRPWFAVLSNIGNHGSLMCLNTKNWHMWLVEQLGGTTDPGLQHLRSTPTKANQNDLENEHSRPAVDLLRDLIQRFRSLEWLPGGLYSERWREYSPLKEIYRKAGWPDKFDPSSFDHLRRENEEAVTTFGRLTAPLERLDNLLTREKQREQAEEEIARQKAEIADLEQRMLDQPDEAIRDDITHKKILLDRQKYNIGVISRDDWNRDQARLREQLKEKQAERQQFFDRQGRFEGMTDDEFDKAVKEGWFEPDINRLKELIADKSIKVRRRREEKEIRDVVAAVDPEIVELWLEEMVQWSGKDGEWVMEWSQFYEAGRDTD